jgi:transposase
LGISDRHKRRWRERYVEQGYSGLLDRRRGQPSRRRVPVATVEKLFALYREKYFDLNVQHFHEKLQAEHGIELSYSWVKQALQGAGLVARGRKRGAHRKRLERRPLPGMLLHSRHQWFQDERWYDLIVILALSRLARLKILRICSLRSPKTQFSFISPATEQLQEKRASGFT